MMDNSSTADDRRLLPGRIAGIWQVEPCEQCGCIVLCSKLEEVPDCKGRKQYLCLHCRPGKTSPETTEQKSKSEAYGIQQYLLTVDEVGNQTLSPVSMDRGVFWPSSLEWGDDE